MLKQVKSFIKDVLLFGDPEQRKFSIFFYSLFVVWLCIEIFLIIRYLDLKNQLYGN